MEFKLNYPLDLSGLKAMITSPIEQHLVWPDSNVPFVETEWLEKLDYSQGHRSYYCLIDEQPVGHVGIRKTDSAQTKHIVFVVVAPLHREMGIARYMINEIEQICLREHLAERLTLRVRSYNKIAKSLYEKCGYSVFSVKGTALDMEKRLINSIDKNL